MNLFLHQMRTPHVALMDGVVMGGGFGVSVHGR
jgi:enoyl-CoA hydratase/carnithine racemase